jgi:hypothetical protein
MDLKTFVAETLTQIVEGVQEAQRRIADGGSGAAVNPNTISSDSQETHGPPTPVEFDVAVVAREESTSNKGEKAGASVGVISVFTARAAGEVDNRDIEAQRNETTSRIKFSVRLAQPSSLTRSRPVSIPSRREV